MTDLVERLREKCGTILVGRDKYSINPPANDPLRLEAATEIERLRAEHAELREDAGRYFTLELLAANGDVRIAFDEDGRIGVHLEEAAECADGSWFGDDLAAAIDAATRQITETDAAIDEAIAARASVKGST